MKRLSRNLMTIYRAESLIARRRIAVVQRRTVLVALAGLGVLAALVALNVAIFLLLAERMAPAGAAGLLAVFNLAIAGLLAWLAGRIDVEQEIAPAVDLRDMAVADIEDELEDIAAEARETVNAIKGAGANPIAALIPVLVPLLAVALQSKGK